MSPQNTSLLPVLFFAFANDRQKGGDFLHELREERRQIRTAFELAIEKGLCEIIIETDTRIEDVYDVFQKKKNRIVLFHYSGHAKKDELLLESKNSEAKAAHSKGLIPFLQRQESLKCVFLNACSTAQQTRTLLNGNIPFVIGTTNEIDDTIARKISVRFYKGLSLGWSLMRSWKDAESEIITSCGGEIRGLFRESIEQSQYPWEQLTKPGAEFVNQWNLPTITRNFLFGLPPLSTNYAPPEHPYRFLKRYKKKDAKVFFGRNQDIRNLYHRIVDTQSTPLILLTGQSGVGKSSLLEAGLLPRFETSYSTKLYRYQKESTLLKCLYEILDIEYSVTDSRPILSVWKEKETLSPMVVIIDQLETVFQKAGDVVKKELEEFLDMLVCLFNSGEERIKGKLILSYRKEYDAELEAMFSNALIPREKVFIQPLQEEGISEVVLGLTSTLELHRYYRLTVEKELAPVIVQDLLSTKNTPIGPTLQIVLTKMWQEQLNDNPEQRIFSLNDYEQMKRSGIFLEDFFKEQMELLKKLESYSSENVEGSGFVLDILNFHTTEQNTAGIVSLDTLKDEYQHRTDILIPLLNKLEELSLLRKVEKSEYVEAYSLIHDTLGPVIKKEFERSSRKGQQAFRILSTKMETYRYKDESTLNEEDLKIVEEGADGMRVWTPEERSLIEKSQKHRAQHVKLKKFRKLVAATGLLLILTLSVIALFFGYQSKKQAKVNSLISQALQEEKQDATKAFQTTQKALEILPGHDAAIQARHDIYSDNEFYKLSVLYQKPVRAAAFVQGGNRMATASGNQVFLINNQGVKTDSLSHPDEVTSLVISPDGSNILTGCKDNIARIWTLDGRLLQPQFPHNDWVNAIAFSPDGQYVLTGSRDGIARLWNRNGEKKQDFVGHQGEITSVRISPDGVRILTGSMDATAKVWNVAGELLQNLKGHEDAILTATFSPDGEHIVTGGRDAQAILWDTSGVIITKLLGHDLRINALEISPDGRFILTVSDDFIIKLWNSSGTLLRNYEGHSDYVLSIAFALDGRRFISGSSDGSLKKWLLESKVAEFYGPHENEVSAIAFSADGEKLITGTGSGRQALFNKINDYGVEFDLFDLESKARSAIVWNMKSKKLHKLQGHHGAITSLAVTPDGNTYFSGSEDSTAIIWNENGDKTTILSGHRNTVSSLAVSSDGKWILTGSFDSTAVLWNNSGDQKQILSGHGGFVSAVAISYDNQFLLTGSYDQTAKIWDFKTGKLLKTLRGHDGRISAVACSPDGKHILTGGWDNTAILWSIEGDSLYTFYTNVRNKTGGQAINAVAFSPDGKFVLLGTEGGMANIFNLNGKKIQTLHNLHQTINSIHAVTFSPDGKWIVTGNGDGYAKRYAFIGR